MEVDCFRTLQLELVLVIHQDQDHHSRCPVRLVLSLVLTILILESSLAQMVQYQSDRHHFDLRCCFGSFKLAALTAQGCYFLSSKGFIRGH